MSMTDTLFSTLETGIQTIINQKVAEQLEARQQNRPLIVITKTEAGKFCAVAFHFTTPASEEQFRSIEAWGTESWVERKRRLAGLTGLSQTTYVGDTAIEALTGVLTECSMAVCRINFESNNVVVAGCDTPKEETQISTRGTLAHSVV